MEEDLDLLLKLHITPTEQFTSIQFFGGIVISGNISENMATFWFLAHRPFQEYFTGNIA